MDLLRLRAVMAGLHPDWRSMMEEIAQGATYEEIAEQFGVPIGTVKSRVSRVRALLVGAFDEAPEYDPAASPEVRALGAGTFGVLPAAAPLAGEEPMLAWLPVATLRVDGLYQREILEKGRTAVLRIYAAFDWRKFGVLVVADRGDGTYALIDGQHRATAAALRGIDRVPVLIVAADRSEQAAAFAAINGARMTISSLHVHAARLAAGDPEAAALHRVCAAAGVEIARYPVPKNKLKRNQTLAVGTCRGALRTHGEGYLVAALVALVAQGALTQHLIKALTAVAARGGLTRETVAERCRALDLRDAQRRAELEAKERRCSVGAVLEPHLEAALKNN